MKMDILERLKSKDEDEKLDALNELFASDSLPFVDEIINIIENDNSNIVRETATDILKFANIKDDFEKIAKMFESTDAYVRNAAIEIFGAKGEEAVPFLTSIMDHKNQEVRKLILDSLVETGSEYAYPALEAALEDEALNVKITAVEYLGSLANKNSKEKVINLLINSDEPMLTATCLETLLEIGDEAVLDVIFDKFDIENGNIDNFYKPFIFNLIGKFGNEEHLSILLKYLNYKNLSFLKDIISSIRILIDRKDINSIDKEYLNFIKQIINSNEANIEIQIECLELIGLLDFDGKFDFLMELTEKQSEDILSIVYNYLCKINKKKTIEDLNKKLKFADKNKKKVYQDILDNIILE